MAIHTLLAASNPYPSLGHTLSMFLRHVDWPAAGGARRLYLLMVDSTQARGAVELQHISKAGGTSMCGLAEANGCSNPHFDEDGNCLIQGFE
jgi:hypothetical protein